MQSPAPPSRGSRRRPGISPWLRACGPALSAPHFTLSVSACSAPCPATPRLPCSADTQVHGLAQPSGAHASQASQPLHGAASPSHLHPLHGVPQVEVAAIALGPQENLRYHRGGGRPSSPLTTSAPRPSSLFPRSQSFRSGRPAAGRRLGIQSLQGTKRVLIRKRKSAEGQGLSRIREDKEQRARANLGQVWCPPDPGDRQGVKRCSRTRGRGLLSPRQPLLHAGLHFRGKAPPPAEGNSAEEGQLGAVTGLPQLGLERGPGRGQQHPEDPSELQASTVQG